MFQFKSRALGALVCSICLFPGVAGSGEIPPEFRDRLAAASVAIDGGRGEEAAAMIRSLPPGDGNVSSVGLQRKLDQLAAGAARAARSASRYAARSSAETENGQAVLWLADASSVGATCARAIHTDTSQTAAIRLDGADGAQRRAWLRWQAPEAGSHALIARGSGTDPALEVFSACGDTVPVATNDDSDGLHAAVVVDAQYAGQQFLVSVENLGPAGKTSILGTSVRVISGTVIDEQGQPIEGVEAYAQTTVGGYAGSAYTDAAGKYALPLYHHNNETVLNVVVRTGSYHSDRRYLHEVWDNVPCSNPSSWSFSTCGSGSTITVPANESVAGIDFELAPGAVVAGRVTSAISGAPIAGASVRVLDGLGDTYGFTTDELGRYVAGGFPDGPVHLSALHPTHQSQVYPDLPCDGECIPAAGEAVQLIIGERATADFALQPHAYIEATLSIDGQPVDDFVYGALRVYHTNGVIVPTGTERTGDIYRVGPLPVGQYLLQASISGAFPQLYPAIDCLTDCLGQLAQATSVEISAPGHVASVAMDLRRLPQFSGTITDVDTGLPVAATVRLLDASSGAWSWLRSDDTDADGMFRIAGIPADSYLVHISAPRYRDLLLPGITCESTAPVEDCAPGEPVVFGLDGDVVSDVALQRSPKIIGRFTESGGRLAAAHPFNSGSVSLLSSSLERQYGTTLTIDGDAQTYELSDFAPGRYFVGARLGGYFTQLADGINCSDDLSYSGCALASVRAYELADQDVVIDFDMVPYGSRRVVVRDADSLTPLAGVGVDWWSTSGELLGTAVTQSDGRANVGSPHVSQVVLSTDNYIGYVDQVYNAISCPHGSAFRGGCSLSGAAELAMPNTDPAAADLVISLRKDGSAEIFADGFE